MSQVFGACDLSYRCKCILLESLSVLLFDRGQQYHLDRLHHSRRLHPLLSLPFACFDHQILKATGFIGRSPSPEVQLDQSNQVIYFMTKYQYLQ